MTTKGIDETLLRDAIGKRLRVLRTRAGASQTQVATAMRVSTTQYQKYETAENRIACCKAVLACKFLKAPIGDLLENLKLIRK